MRRLSRPPAVSNTAGQVGSSLSRAFQSATLGAEGLQGTLAGVSDAFSAIGGKAGKILGAISSVIVSLFGTTVEYPAPVILPLELDATGA